MLRLPGFQSIARRYFIVNGFDGALTMLGLILGFYISQNTDYRVTLNVCLGAAIALTMSGLTSAYVSESAEKKKELSELEQAMIDDLTDTDYGRSTKYLPILIALVNGLSPLLISLVVVLPIVINERGISTGFDPLLTSLGVAGVVLFLLGVFLGRISETNWLWAGLRTLLIAIVTAGLIFILSPAA